MQHEKKFALDNPTYDVITILHEKSKALEAYDKYLKDAGQDNELRTLLEEIRRTDEQHCERLHDHLMKMMDRHRGRQAA